jgi:hypothetical protein
VHYATADGTATVADHDYKATSGTLTFAPGQTSQKINVTVYGDTGSEPNETFYVNLSSPTNAIIGHARGVGTILDGAAALSLSVISGLAPPSGTGTPRIAAGLPVVAPASSSSPADRTPHAGTPTATHLSADPPIESPPVPVASGSISALDLALDDPNGSEIVHLDGPIDLMMHGGPWAGRRRRG